ncbi:MAG: DUF192 domain-containing protein [Lentisphaerales bacterium]|nr:MAG: DUF192 domain-containing protein [Lentisphaerales bacterium]
MNMATLASDGVVLIGSLECARTLHERCRGLLGRKALPAGVGMHISPCSSVHTFFMQFDLDLFFIGRAGAIVKIARNVTPARIVFGGAKAHSVVEVQSGWLAAGSLSVGDAVAIEPSD